MTGKRSCIGSEPAYENWFHYARQFLKEYSDLPQFLAMHQDSLSHDDINLIEVENEIFTSHLETMENDGLLDNAPLIVIADHGHRFMKIRDTQQGQLEERLPMFSLTLPKKLRDTARGKKIYANLLANRDILTTPFDIYETLWDVLNPPEDVTKPQKRERDEKLQTEILSVGLTQAIDAANQLEKVKFLCQCDFKRVLHAAKLTVDKGVFKYKMAQDKDGFEPSFKEAALTRFANYQLKIMTRSNDAIYEGSVYFDSRKGELEVDLQALSHVNAYGNDQHCVDKSHNQIRWLSFASATIGSKLLNKFFFFCFDFMD